jgi:hypothetical protein
MEIYDFSKASLLQSQRERIKTDNKTHANTDCLNTLQKFPLDPYILCMMFSLTIFSSI